MRPLPLSVLLLLGAMFAIALEVFIPSAGIMAVLAVVGIVSALVVAFQGSFELGMFMSLVTVVCIPVAIALALRVWPHTPIGRRIFMQRPTAEEVLPDSESRRERQELVGVIGQAKTDLLPSGAVVINEKTFEALSEGMAINAGEVIKVVALRTNRLVVKRATEQDRAEGIAALEGQQGGQDLLSQPLEEFGLESFDDPLS